MTDTSMFSNDTERRALAAWLEESFPWLLKSDATDINGADVIEHLSGLHANLIAPDCETYTVFLRYNDSGGMFITAVQARSHDEAYTLAETEMLTEALADCDPSMYCSRVGLAEGDVYILEWDDEQFT